MEHRFRQARGLEQVSLGADFDVRSSRRRKRRVVIEVPLAGKGEIGPQPLPADEHFPGCFAAGEFECVAERRHGRLMVDHFSLVNLEPEQSGPGFKQDRSVEPLRLFVETGMRVERGNEALLQRAISQK